jgi:uncharacterized protein with HEPN domain
VKRDAREYLEHAEVAIRAIEEWTREGRQTFFNDLRTRAAMIRMLQELSESIWRLHDLVGDRYPELPWREVIAFRHVIVHDYLGLNFERIWQIATTNVPALRPHIQRTAAERSVE